MQPSTTNTSAPVRLIVNADDFGLHPAVNQAVAQGHKIGIVTSCSLFPRYGTPAFDEAVQIAQQNPQLDVGLHFALVGMPNQPDGYKEFLIDYWKGKYPDERIAEMLALQIEALTRSGITPTHIDSHQHLHALPRVMNVVCDVAREKKIPAVRLPLENPPPVDVPRDRLLASRVLAAAANKAEPYIVQYDLWRPDYFMGMAISGHLTEARLLNMLDRLPHGVTEIVCHPGVDNKTLAAEFPDWGYNWEGERAAVIGERILYHIASQGIELTTFAREAAAKNVGKVRPASVNQRY